jgi:hypothetical protein
MVVDVKAGDRRLWGWFRGVMWGGAALLLLLPALAMRWSGEVNWSAGDFVLAAVLLFGSAGLIELAARSKASMAYRAGAAIAVGAGLLTLWANAAVGMIGNEDNAYNLWFLGVVALALVGAVVVRLRARALGQVMMLAAAAQAVLAAVGMTMDVRGGVFSLMFAGLWLLASALFRKAAAEA